MKSDKKAASSKEQFLNTIFEHQALIHKVCRIYRDSKEDREDLFQEIVFQLWRSYPRFRGNAKITSWMYRISLNTALATFRKPKLAASDINKISENDLTDEVKEDDSYEEKLSAAIKKLDASEKAVISLYLEGLSYAEMADIIGISEIPVFFLLKRY